MAKGTNINAYKDRMSAPVGVVLTNPKTRKPIKTKTTASRTAKGKK